MVIQYFKVIFRLSCLSGNHDCQLPTQESTPEPKFQYILNITFEVRIAVSFIDLRYMTSCLSVDITNF